MQLNREVAALLICFTGDHLLAVPLVHFWFVWVFLRQGWRGVGDSQCLAVSRANHNLPAWWRHARV